MPVEISAEYLGELRCRAVHGPSGSAFETDAPLDHCGKGERFSPTDLVATALATCILTTIGIIAQRKGWDVRGMRARVEKHMSSEGPRRIARLPVHLVLPTTLPPEARAEVERIARECPVSRCLRPEIEEPITIDWA